MKASSAIILAIGEAGGVIPGWQFSTWLKELGRLGYLEAEGTDLKLTKRGQEKLNDLRAKEKEFQPLKSKD